MAQPTHRDTPDAAREGWLGSSVAKITARDDATGNGCARRGAITGISRIELRRFSRETARDPDTKDVRPSPRDAAITARDDSSSGNAHSEDAPEDISLGGALAKYRILRRMAGGSEAELYLAELPPSGERAVIKLYHAGVIPDPDAAQRIEACSRDHVIAVIERGQAGGRYFEVMEHARHGSLRSLFHEGRGLHDSMCLLFLGQLAPALEQLHLYDSAGRAVIHGDIKPENILVRNHEPLDLVLGDPGIAVPLCSGHEPVARAGLTEAYAAPEARQGHLYRKSDYWSLGMVLLEALQGKPPLNESVFSPFGGTLDQELQDALQDIQNPAWQRLLSGLLTRNPQQRWGAREVGDWLAREAYPYPQYHGAGLGWDDGLFAGQPSRRDLAAALALEWEAACQALDDDRSFRELSHEIQRLAPDIRTDDLRHDVNATANLRLLRLIYRLDPGLEPIWRGLSLDSRDMATLCASACRDNNEHSSLVQEIWAQDILGELGKARADATLLRNAAAWREAARDHEEAWGLVQRLGGPVEARPEEEVALPRLYLAACAPEQIELRSDADLPHPADMVCCLWLRVLDQRRSGITPARRYLLTVLLPYAEYRFRNNFQETYEFAPGALVQAEPAARIGRNSPLVSFSALHTDIRFQFCNEMSQIGKRVRLFWSVSNAGWVFLRGFGRVAAVGSCEVSIGHTQDFSLVAVGGGGISVWRIPDILVTSVHLDPDDLALNPPPAIEPDISPESDPGSPGWHEELRLDNKAIDMIAPEPMPGFDPSMEPKEWPALLELDAPPDWNDFDQPDGLNRTGFFTRASWSREPGE